MNALAQLIKDRIACRGPITFRDFMEMALYYPGLGYYCQGKDRVGDGGDFYTSPATHPVFGALLAAQLEQMWRRLGSPSDFTVVEFGAGKGLLARDIAGYLPHLGADFASSLRYITVERAKPEAPEAPGEFTGCILSNELLDALPVHRVVCRGATLEEIFVDIRDGSFGETTGAPSSSLLELYLKEEDVSLSRGQTAEINLDAVRWVGDVAGRLKRGFVVTIDYGYPASELYSVERRQGTLMTYARHIAGTDPYLDIGQQDITSHVDFTAVVMAGQKGGLSPLGLVSQGRFLRDLGLRGFVDALRCLRLPHDHYLENRYAMLELIKPEGFGDFKVLVQEKGVGRVGLYGLTPGNEFSRSIAAQKESLHAPLLTRDHAPLARAKYPHLFEAGRNFGGPNRRG